MRDPRKDTRRVLVIDDEPGINDLCRVVLEGDGFDVDTVLNGRDAQPLIAQDDEYDVCLVDVRTPEMTGMEFYQWIREEHPQLADRVIFTTGDTMFDDTRSFLEQSGRPLLPKPFTPSELRGAIREALGR
ncbi:MAG: response regulator [Dehalococcoidia bacterium]